MLANFHTHTTFCDGESTPEEIVIAAMEKGFSAIGFSGHGYTAFDTRYCMRDEAGYLHTLRQLRKKYGEKIEIYIGLEEDAFAPVRRENYDYIIGSSHYFRHNGRYYPIDSGPEYFKECLELFDGNISALAESYYCCFCDYILRRKPDIVGHFDLITKFDEIGSSLFFANEEYNRLAERYLRAAMKSGCFFEVNTGAISRGYRTTPYPSENLLYVLKKEGGRLILSSDSHSAGTLDFWFDEAKALLREIGFDCVYTISDHRFVRQPL